EHVRRTRRAKGDDGVRVRPAEIGTGDLSLQPTNEVVVRITRYAYVALIAALSSAAEAAAQQPPVPARGAVQGAAVRAAARKYREAHEADIAREFADLLAIPNVASDSVNIRRNTAAVVELLRRRG